MNIQQLTPDDAATYQELRLFALQESPAAFGSSYQDFFDEAYMASRLQGDDCRDSR